MKKPISDHLSSKLSIENGPDIMRLEMMIRFGPNLAWNVVFRLFLPNAAINVPNSCYRNLFWCLLLGKPILDWPKFALFVVIWQNYIYHYSFCFFDLLLLYFLYLIFFCPRRSRPLGLWLVVVKIDFIDPHNVKIKVVRINQMSF